jgi:hypothetical protein
MAISIMPMNQSQTTARPSRLWASEMGLPVRLGISHHREPMPVRVTRLATCRWKCPGTQAVLWTT